MEYLEDPKANKLTNECRRFLDIIKSACEKE